MTLQPPRASLVCTVLNEAATLDALLRSVAAQTRAPDEVVVVDGGSRDGTWEQLATWQEHLPLRRIRADGANIARGRNIAIQGATGEIIAVTDAGVRLDPHWLERLLAALRPDVDVVAGFFRPDASNAFETAMGATVLPDVSDVRPERFLPSSRSVLFRRAAWQAVGGYPEWLDYCEDVVFDLQLKASGYRFQFEPAALAYFRPRGTLEAFFRQYYLYARGDGKADLFRRRHALRYAVYLGALAVLGLTRGRGWALLVPGGLLYVRRPYQRLLPHVRSLGVLGAGYALCLVPLIRLVGDVAKMLGYPVGVLWRARRRANLSGKRTYDAVHAVALPSGARVVPDGPAARAASPARAPEGPTDYRARCGRKQSRGPEATA